MRTAALAIRLAPLAAALLWAALGAAFGAALVSSGCSADPTRGYSFDPTHDSRVRTVSVPIFGNESYHSGLEVRLTEAIIKEIQRATPWRVVGSENAATTLQGTITDVDLRMLSRQRDSGLVQEQAVIVEVSFDWTDNRTGQTRVSRRGFEGIASFVPHRGVGEPIENAENAALRELARDIVAELRTDW